MELLILGGIVLAIIGAAASSGARKTVRKTYRVSGGGHTDYYKMNYIPKGDGTVKIVCDSHPANPQSAASPNTHLQADGEVCVAKDHKPRTQTEAEKIGRAWMDGYSNYIRSGRFPKSG